MGIWRVREGSNCVFYHSWSGQRAAKYEGSIMHVCASLWSWDTSWGPWPQSVFVHFPSNDSVSMLRLSRTKYLLCAKSLLRFDKLVVAQLVNKVSALCKILRPITVFTGRYHRSLSYARWIQYMPMLILSSHLCLGLRLPPQDNSLISV